MHAEGVSRTVIDSARAFLLPEYKEESINPMATMTTTYDFDFVFDGPATLSDLLTQIVTERILRKMGQNPLPKSEKTGYNKPIAPSCDGPGLCEVNS